MKSEEIFSIDFVITWVDGSDKEWLAEKAKFGKVADIDATAARYRDFGTLRYLLRSIEKFAPWVRKIFLVTNGQIPEWLSFENPKLQLVKHSDYMPPEYLPTFSSHPIEWNLHKIEGLSEWFVYFNDDLILTSPVEPTDFFCKGMPCDTFGLGMIRPNGFFSQIPFNHMLLLNERFDFRSVMKEHKRKFFKLKYGKRLLKTLLLSKMSVFYGMYDPHLANSFRKSMFSTLWDEHGELINQTCKNKFRSKSDISIWMVRYYQMLLGEFAPRSDRFGKFYDMHDFVNMNGIEQILIKGKRKMICVNDSESLNLDFEVEKERFCGIMDTILGEKCSFEK